jgi:hypothetical protein|nr:MAG TPA: PGDYG protein [Caudoviricetes sp.]
MLALYTIKPKATRYKAIQIRGKDIDEILKLFVSIRDKYPDIYPFTLRVQRNSISMYWGSLPSGTPVEAREGDYIIFADDSWTIVEKENFNNEYVITDDIEELIYIHKDMEDFKFLGTKSTEITVQIKDK